MQNVLNHVACLLSHLTGKRRTKIKKFRRSVHDGYYKPTAVSYDVIYDVFVLFTFA